MYRINSLLKENQKLFHTTDLALLWGITNQNTLYTTIKRYVQRGILVPIHKGLYSAVSPDNLSSILLGSKSLHTYSYVSTETVLFASGVLNQSPQNITLISSVSRRFTILNHSFLVRQIMPQFLYNPIGISQKEGYFVASPERALADMLYINPQFHMDSKKTVNWSILTSMRKEIGYL